jgi:hypothetical protein
LFFLERKIVSKGPPAEPETINIQTTFFPREPHAENRSMSTLHKINHFTNNASPERKKKPLQRETKEVTHLNR